MATLHNRPTLADYQTYIKEACEERGWNNRTAIEKMMLLTEEVGELAKAIRKETGTFGYEKPDSIGHLEEELVDVLNHVIDIANGYDVDLEKAFRDKWDKVDHRTWHGDKYRPM